MSPRRLTARRLPLLVAMLLPFAEAEAKEPRSPHSVTQSAADRSAPLIAQGVMALAARNFVAAYAALSDAYLIDPSADTLYQMGIVAYAEGQTILAQDLLRRYLVSSPASEKNSQQRAEAERIVSQPQGQSSELVLSGEAHQRVYFDRRLVGILPLPLPLLVPAGKHSLLIKSATAEWTATLETESHRAYQLTPQRVGQNDGQIVGQIAVERLPTALLEVDGDLPQGTPNPHPLLTESIRKSGLFVLPPQSGREECKGEARCTIRIAEQSFADYLLTVGGVQAASSAGGSVALSLLDTEIGEVASQASFPCSPCSDGVLAESISGVLPRLLAEAKSRGRGTLHIDSQPAGAMVQIGGRKVGATPLDLPRFAGPAEVTLHKPGFKPWQERTETLSGQRTDVLATLRAEEIAPLIVKLPPERRPRPRWRIAAGLTSLGVGLGLAGLGVSALLVSGHCVEPAAPPLMACTRLYDTTPTGAGLIAAGAVLSVTGAVLLAIPGPRNRDLRPVPTEAAGPWALSQLSSERHAESP